jgi:hypothetical protein
MVLFFFFSLSQDPLVKVLKSLSNASAAPAQNHAAPASAGGASAAAAASTAVAKSSRKAFSRYASLSKVGYVPFNPNKGSSSTTYLPCLVVSHPPLCAILRATVC